MLPQVLTQQFLIQRLARRLRTRMGMSVNQARQQPALRDKLRAGHRVGGPPVPVGIQVDCITVRQREPANPGNRHQTRMPADRLRFGGILSGARARKCVGQVLGELAVSLATAKSCCPGRFARLGCTLGVVATDPDARPCGRPWTIWLPGGLAVAWSGLLIIADGLAGVMGSWYTPPPGLYRWVRAGMIGHCALAAASVLVLAGLRFPSWRRAAAVTAWDDHPHRVRLVRADRPPRKWLTGPRAALSAWGLYGAAASDLAIP
jgi:hypothetical protein